MFSKKDLKSIAIAKQCNIKHFTLSFINTPNDVIKFRSLYPGSVLYAKIETLQGVMNASSILDVADGILIDRGDLSREIPIEKIPLVQKYLIELASLKNKECFVASNLLETMSEKLKPSRAEANDIINTILDGATGFVLTKETAVGKYPIEVVNFLNSLMSNGEFVKKFTKKTNDYETRIIDLYSLKQSGYFTDKEDKGGLVEPHGGKLVDRVGGEHRNINRMPLLKFNHVLTDMNKSAAGSFIRRVFCKRDYDSVVENVLPMGQFATLCPDVSR